MAELLRDRVRTLFEMLHAVRISCKSSTSCHTPLAALAFSKVMRPGLKRPACNFILDPYQKVGISSHSSLPSASRGRISCKSSTLPPLLTHPLSPFSSSKLSHAPRFHTPSDAASQMRPLLPYLSTIISPDQRGLGAPILSPPTQKLSISAQRNLYHYPRASLLPISLPLSSACPRISSLLPLLIGQPPQREFPRNSSLPSRLRAAPPETASSLPLTSSPKQREILEISTQQRPPLSFLLLCAAGAPPLPYRYSLLSPSMDV